VEVDQELDLKLVEVGLFDAQAGVGKVKTLNVVVAGAAKLVGKKVRVRVGAVMDGVAYAELLDGGNRVAPITAETEAEKPTRARRPGKKAEDAGDDMARERKSGVAEPDAVPPAEGAAEPLEAGEQPAETPKRPRRAAPVAEGDAVEVEAVEGEPTEAEGPEEAPPKKRTRRGTRGGRNRRKKPAAAEGETGAGVEPEAQEEEAESGPVIHLPSRELDSAEEEPSENGDQPEAPRKRTSRGTRGGRSRRRKPVAAAATPEAVDAAEEDAAENGSAPAEAADWEYTPMSEWGDE
jgi:predicted RNA-binding protein with TRAM domain